MAETRQRKAFHHQDDGSDDGPEALDEQEQEKLIAKLTQQNQESNDDYLRLLMIIPMVSWLIFIVTFIRARYAAPRFMSLLGITSLWATAYHLLFVPTAPKGGREPPKFTELKSRMRVPVPTELSPAQKYVPLLNGILTVLVGLWGLTTRDGKGVMEGFWLTCWIPAVEYVMIQLARKWIVEVNPEDLEQLKYDLRGA